MQFPINLVAGAQWQRQQTAGRYLVIISTGVASSVELRLVRGNDVIEEIRTAERGFKARVPERGFDSVELRASVDCAVELVISDGLVDFDFMNGAEVFATITGLPLAVSNDRGTPGNLLHVTAVTVADTPATAAGAHAPVAVTSAGAVVAAANANRRAMRFTNLGPDPVAIGPAGATWAQRVVVLDVDDTWLEDRGANLAWSAITDAGKTASVTWQDVTA